MWRNRNPNKIQYTWSRKDRSESTRIDYFLIAPDVFKNCVSCDIRPIVLQYTDHNCVSLKINLSRGQKGRGYWKLNSSVLQNEDYIEIINKIIKNYKNKAKTKTELDILWDNFKIEVRDQTINYCKIKAKNKKDQISQLEKMLTELNKIIDKSSCNDKNKSNLVQKVENIENEIGKLYNEKIKGNRIRARVKWVEEEEKNSAYFLGIEKSRQSSKTITQLYDRKGQVTKDPTNY